MWPIAWYIFLYAQWKRLQHPREAEGPRRIGFHNKLALIVCQHSRSWKSSIHFRSRGKAQSLIFQLDLFIKTQQIFYIPHCGQRPQAGRAATAELGSPLESGDWGISHEQSMWISQEENTQHRSDDCHTHSLFSQHQGVKLKSARQHLDTNLAHGLVISPPQYYREWIECFYSGSQCQPPASRPPVAGQEVRAEVRQPGGAPCHSARRRGARGHETSPDKHQAGVPADRDGRRGRAPSVCDLHTRFQTSFDTIVKYYCYLLKEIQQ